MVSLNGQFGVALLVVVLSGLCVKVLSFTFFSPRKVYENTSIFNFTVESKGESVSLSKYKGKKKAFLIVNVASKCGLTNSNYPELVELHEKYASKGLEILAFPCNNFAQQEPGSNEDICQFAKNKGASFPIFDKLDCSGKDGSHPLYQYLTNTIDGGIIFGTPVRWNFAKFLCDADGIPVKRYSPITKPLSIEPDLLSLLAIESESKPSNNEKPL